MVKGSVSITVKKNLFPKIAAALPDLTSMVVEKTLNDVIVAATPLTPVDTSFLRNSAAVFMESSLTGYVMWAAHYAKFQEFGTRYIAPRLFATGGAEAVRPQFIRAMEAMLAGLGN
jgi:hypothetical protein